MKKIKIKFYLNRVPLDRQGYTRDGHYFGAGEPLYYHESTTTIPVPWPRGSRDYLGGHLRASSREDAKEQIRKKYEYYSTANGESLDISFFN